MFPVSRIRRAKLQLNKQVGDRGLVMGKYFFEDDVPEYYWRQLNALLALGGEENAEIPTDSHACASGVVSLLQEGQYGLSDSTLERIDELTVGRARDEDSEETEEKVDSILRIILAVVALQELATDKHGIWDCPERVLARIGETAAGIEAAASSYSVNPIEVETHAEKIVAAAITAKALGSESLESVFKGTPAWAMGCAEAIRAQVFEMILTDSFEELEDVLESFEPIVTSLLLSHVLLTNDFLARSDGAKDRIDSLVAQLEEAVAAGTRDSLDEYNAEATAFIELATSREALRMAAGSIDSSEMAIANQVMGDFDLALEEGTEEEMRRAAERATPAIESLAALTLVSNAETTFEHVDELLESALLKWKDDLRSSILADDVDTLAAKRQRFERLFESFVSFEVLCMALETLQDGQGSDVEMCMSLDQLRTAIASGDVVSADKGIRESYVLLNGSLYLHALDEIMTSEDETGLAGLCKANLAKQYVDLKMAVTRSDCSGIERVIGGIEKNLYGNAPLMRASDEQSTEDVKDPIVEDEGSEASPLTALELVAAATSMELKAAEFEAFLETEEGRQMVMEALVERAVFGSKGGSVADSVSERLGLGKVSEW